VIAEKDIDFVFNVGVIAELAKDIKLPADADIARFSDNIRIAARSYFTERERAKNIRLQVEELYRLVDKADRGDETAVARLAGRLVSVNQSTRHWLAQCVHRPISFPSPDEIRKIQTRQDAMRRLRSILSYGLKWVKDRQRPSGRHSVSLKPVLRVPQHRLPPDEATASNRIKRGDKSDQSEESPKRRPGRPRDLAARELVQCLALTYLEATGRSPPRRVSSASQGPFLRLVITPLTLFTFRPGMSSISSMSANRIEKKWRDAQ